MSGIRNILLVILAAVYFAANSYGQSVFSLPEGVKDTDYVHGQLIFKLKAEAVKIGGESTFPLALEKVLSEVSDLAPKRVFPLQKSPEVKWNVHGEALIDLSLIYECQIKTGMPIEAAINLILKSACVEYAQPRYVVRPMNYTPNDPVNVNQYHLGLMQFPAAWDIEKGDTNMVVGVTDWGIDMAHPDLIGNIKYNYNDTIDGLDNDNDGYIDNYYGWDMGMNDNNPTGIIVHGTYSTGCSSATTDNGTGVSGTGFRCKFLPIKVADDNNIGTMGYESMVYAADHGCKVINASWGSPFYMGPFGQDIANYVTINRGAMIFAACGNDNNASKYYPASYDHVVSVAATNSMDVKWTSSSTSGSNYGSLVDLSAPGQWVWTTAPGATYNYSSGTSFAAPLAAGAAALLWSHLPAFTAEQIEARLKATCDLIDTVTGNQSFAGMLGAGRINMFRALTDTTSSYVQLINPVFEDDDHNLIFDKGDTIILYGDIINYLAPTSANLRLELSSASPYITFIDSVFMPGSLATLGTLNNMSNPFRFVIHQDVPPSYSLVLRLDCTDTTGASFQYTGLNVNSDYITVDTNRIAVSFASDGGIGYNKGNYAQGVGVTYDHGVSLMSLSGMLIGVSSSQVSDVVMGFGGTLDHDFFSVQNIAQLQTPLTADYGAIGFFNDSGAGTGSMDITVKQYVRAWNRPGLEKFVTIEYTIINNGTAELDPLYASIFIDWDIKNSMENIATQDAARKMGYTYPYGGGPHGAIKVLSDGGFYHYAFDIDGSDGSIELDDGFTGFEKYYAMHNNRSSAGNFIPGNDVAEMVSTGPYTLYPGDSVRVAFALLVGDQLADIQEIADSAQQAYQAAIAAISTTDMQNTDYLVFPNPFENEIFVKFERDIPLNVTYNLYNALGQCVFTGDQQKFNPGPNVLVINSKSITSGLYLLQLHLGEEILTKKVLKN